MEECERIFNSLAEDGTIEMPLEQAARAEKFGVCADRLGVQWMVTYTGSVVFPPAS